ncbi:hypothetical protein DFP72DRAFT_1075077 [Ephemerocybe angulata]|uniref:Uncharacterized protein n=1 Tax=Ephemerocybe angulata TaxID=980116 RepID=A0A8H6M0B0_9AGAR|nr:hypothetical protein DFP72DRAFT_1075077 [Tulosesus angulatus]
MRTPCRPASILRLAPLLYNLESPLHAKAPPPLKELKGALKSVVYIRFWTLPADQGGAAAPRAPISQSPVVIIRNPALDVKQLFARQISLSAQRNVVALLTFSPSSTLISATATSSNDGIPSVPSRLDFYPGNDPIAHPPPILVLKPGRGMEPREHGARALVQQQAAELEVIWFKGKEKPSTLALEVGTWDGEGEGALPSQLRIAKESPSVLSAKEADDEVEGSGGEGGPEPFGAQLREQNTNPEPSYSNNYFSQAHRLSNIPYDAEYDERPELEAVFRRDNEYYHDITPAPVSSSLAVTTVAHVIVHVVPYPSARVSTRRSRSYGPDPAAQAKAELSTATASAWGSCGDIYDNYRCSRFLVNSEKSRAKQQYVSFILGYTTSPRMVGNLFI